MATTSNKLADVPQPVSGSDVLSANLLCVQNGRVTQVPGYLKKIQDIQKSVDDFKTAVFDMVYPVGSYYWSSNATNPGSMFGGIWEQIKDRFVLAAGGTYTVNSTGVEATHTLSVNEMPKHNHSASTNTTGNHNHYSNLKGTNDEMLNAGLVANAAFAGRCYVTGGNLYSSTNGNHSHSVTINNTGGGAAHNNMPPYIVAYCWHRTA